MSFTGKGTNMWRSVGVHNTSPLSLLRKYARAQATSTTPSPESHKLPLSHTTSSGCDRPVLRHLLIMIPFSTVSPLFNWGDVCLVVSPPLPRFQSPVVAAAGSVAAAAVAAVAVSHLSLRAPLPAPTSPAAPSFAPRLTPATGVPIGAVNPIGRAFRAQLESVWQSDSDSNLDPNCFEENQKKGADYYNEKHKKQLWLATRFLSLIQSNTYDYFHHKLKNGCYGPFIIHNVHEGTYVLKELDGRKRKCLVSGNHLKLWYPSMAFSSSSLFLDDVDVSDSDPTADFCGFIQYLLPLIRLKTLTNYLSFELMLSLLGNSFHVAQVSVFSASRDNALLPLGSKDCYSHLGCTSSVLSLIFGISE
ncbi:hypothetical protein BDR26DRAFT_932727 [Obelidium mucronatum]|nr:hypothetical protein BDR26DRAFT_932727 [Obelidium mucronatum]